MTRKPGLTRGLSYYLYYRKLQRQEHSYARFNPCNCMYVSRSVRYVIAGRSSPVLGMHPVVRMYPYCLFLVGMPSLSMWGYVLPSPPWLLPLLLSLRQMNQRLLPWAMARIWIWIWKICNSGAALCFYFFFWCLIWWMPYMLLSRSMLVPDQQLEVGPYLDMGLKAQYLMLMLLKQDLSRNINFEWDL